MPNKEDLLALLGNPELWPHIHLGWDDKADSIQIYKCPYCGAMVWNVFQHKEWHLQVVEVRDVPDNPL